MTIKVLLVDDHEIMREGLYVLLQRHSDIEVVGQAADGRSAIDMVRTLSPDIIIMDISMPNLNGIDATRQILAEYPNVRIMAMSTHSDRSMVAKMLKAGATGYMLKSSAFSELISGIRAVSKNKTFLCTKVANVVLTDYVNMLGDPKRGSTDNLTSRERQVLQMVAEGHPTKQIAASMHVSVKTVDSHRSHIMEKLNIHNMAGLTKYAIREGLTTL